MAESKPRNGSASPRVLFGVTFTITTCILVIVAVGMVAVTWQQWDAAKQRTDELQHRNALLLMSQVESYLEQFLLPAEAYVQEMSSLPVLNDINNPALLSASLAAAPQIVEAGFLTVDGRDTVVERSDGALSFQTVERAGESAFEAGRQLRAMATTPRWDNPVYDPDAQASVVTVWQAVRRDGQYLGAWHASVSVAALSEAVTRIGDKFDGTAFVMFGANSVLAHPNLASQHPDAAPGHPGVDVNRVGDLVLDGIWAKALGIVEASDDQAELFVTSYDEGGDTYAGYLRRVYDYGSAPWTLGVWFHTDPAGVLYRSVMNSLLFGGLLILISLVVAFFAGRMISRPIVRTAKAVETIGSGDILKVPALPPSNIAELNDLARAFNAMRRGLAVFETYVPRSLVRRLVLMDDAKLESEERELTIMFTDIVGFTSISEGKSPAEVAELVNEHFDLMGKCVDQFGGTIDKYMGDGMMAFWGAPEEIDDPQVRACYCAMGIVDAIEKYNFARRKEGLPNVRVRIGIHSGPVLVGNIGAEGRVNYTVIGDTVNTCQRIESLGREVTGRNMVTILVSDTVVKHLPASMPYVEVGSFSVKGREEPVVAYQIKT